MHVKDDLADYYFKQFFDESFGKIISGENFDVAITRRTYEKYLLDKGTDIKLPEMKFAIEIASRGGTDMVIECPFGWRNGIYR